VENSLFSTGRIDGYIRLTLIGGCDDWVQASEIIGNIFNLDTIFHKDVAPEVLKAVRDANGTAAEFTIARDLSVEIIRRVLTEDLMMIGDIGNGFIPWPLTIEGSLRKVEAMWATMGGKLPGHGVYWLCNTDRGYEIGEKALIKLRKATER
jgi:hypothetical protein